MWYSNLCKLDVMYSTHLYTSDRRKDILVHSERGYIVQAILFINSKQVF